jgi:F0F1-type ATP synthase delta subunit
MKQRVRSKKRRKPRPVRIKVVSAQELDTTTLERIHSLFGSEFPISAETDTKVIGGLEIKKTNELFDGTIRGQLNKLRHKLYNLKAYGEH